MADVTDKELDDLLGGHLAGRLDAQLGRAARGFMAGAVRERRRQWAMRTAWGVTGIAACVAVALWSGRGGAGTEGGALVVQTVATEPEVPTEDTAGSLERVILSDVRDGGTVFLDDRPVRRLLRREMEHVRWTDPSGRWSIEATVPAAEEVMFVDLRKY